VGLAYDYCVGSTAFDAIQNGFKTYLIRDGTKSVAKDSEDKMKQRLDEAGVIEINSSDLL
jgi:nicotinamidase-related amidase